MTKSRVSHQRSFFSRLGEPQIEKNKIKTKEKFDEKANAKQIFVILTTLVLNVL